LSVRYRQGDIKADWKETGWLEADRIHLGQAVTSGCNEFWVA